MSKFTKITTLPVYDLYSELLTLQEQKSIKWHGDQICINTIVGKEDNYHYGNGSLFYDWDKSYSVTDDAGIERMVVPEREVPLREQDFTELCNIFKGTLFEEVYVALTSQYPVGRVRLMKSKPKSCLTWHTDETNRIHYPLKTQDGCFMVIGSEIKFLEPENWWYTYTQTRHTAFNASREDRIHLVATVIV